MRGSSGASPRKEPAEHQDNWIRQQQPRGEGRHGEDDGEEHDDDFELVQTFHWQAAEYDACVSGW